jgi:DHA1 family bicyclomycin/chloramphenicol resistance-like MFS transporter
MKPQFSKIMVLVVVLLMDILGGAEIDLFVPSFPEIKNIFQLTPFWVEALLSVNFIGYCLSLLFVGSLADRYGRKKVILLGLFIFTIGSILCSFATSYEFLIAGRFLQGVGIAAPAILCFVIIADTYPLKQQQYLFAVLNSLVNIIVAIAPVIGSYITMYYHWHGNFVALLLFGLITLVATMIFIPSSKLPKHKESLSLTGYLPIFKSKPSLILMIILICTSVPYWLFLGMSSILYIEDLGVSLSHYGYYQGAWALVYALGSIVGSVIINRFDQKKMLYISALGYIFSLIIIGFIALIDSRNPLFISLAFLPYSIAAIIPAILLYPLYLNYIPEIKGRASAILQGIRLILTAFSIEVAGYYYTGSFKNIGILICFFIFIATCTLFMVIRNKELMKFMEAK